MAAPTNAALDRSGPGAGTSGGRAGGLLAASGPILAMLAALALVAATGLSQRDAVPEALEPWIFGYYIGRYPLFAFALVYGLGHLARVATAPGPASAPRRILFGLAGAAALLAAGLYPTFGGLILRGAFATGSMAFLTHQPLWLAYGLGAAVGALMFGGVLGLFAVAANRPLRPRLRRVGSGSLAFVALWFGAILIGLGGDLGVGPWPLRAMRPEEAALAACLLIAAALPHTALATLRRHRRTV